MKFSIQSIGEGEAGQIATWRYEEPYTVYNLTALAIPGLLDPEFHYHSVRDDSGRLVGFCCFGADARVSGGDYARCEPDVLDVGLGMHPDMTGRGQGRVFTEAILAFATEAFKPSMFRVTIAEFNQRSQRVFLGLGFMKTGSYERAGDGMRFIQFERQAEVRKGSDDA
jgi:RimJ/RimL family protein N-acetyltransferase